MWSCPHICCTEFRKNVDVKHDSEMHKKKKRNNWYFGMKVHIGVDADSGLVHITHTMPANISDVSETLHVLHGAEMEVFADVGYTGAPKRNELHAI